MNDWKIITNAKWVLEIIQKGYKLEFLTKMAFRGIKHTRVPPDQNGAFKFRNRKSFKRKCKSLFLQHFISSCQKNHGK